jgi:putative spermidine/putrescine transport system ATP-binding protein
MARLTLNALGKTFGTTTAVAAFSLDVKDGELVCLLGPSGSGKSTLLRMVGGFETPTSGEVLIDGEVVTRTPPERRPTAMVFQSHALWTHMNVFGNIAFGLRIRRLPKAEIASRVGRVLALVGLEGYVKRQTKQLSGGQQQRVAIARALVLEPKILLLDEPFASLDQHLRERLREEVRDIQHRLGITTLFVTHGQDEALSLADRIVVLKEGRAEQVGAPAEVYRSPATPFVAGFIGSMNRLPGSVEAGRFRHGALELPLEGVPDGPAELAVRPEHLVVRAAPGGGAASLRRLTDYGTHRIIDLETSEGARLKAQVADGADLPQGPGLQLEPTAWAVFRNDQVIARSPA